MKTQTGRNIGRTEIRSDDIKIISGIKLMTATKGGEHWNAIGKAYFQQWTVMIMLIVMKSL